MTQDESAQPKIVGFETKPPTYNPSITDWQTLGYTAAGVAVLLFLFCSYTGTPFMQGAPRRDRSKDKSVTQYTTAEETKRRSRSTLEEVIERQKEITRRNQEIFDSIRDSYQQYWQD